MTNHSRSHASARSRTLSRRLFLKACAGTLLTAGMMRIAGCRSTTTPWDSSRSGSRILPTELFLPLSREGADLATGSIVFIGTATVLIRYAGFTILTDPNFLHRGESVHLGYGLRSQRLTEPAINFEDLPPFDFVLLSHLHEDHFDRLVNQRLNRSIPITTTPKAADSLSRGGFQKTFGLRTWEAMTFSKGSVHLRVTAMPGRHGPSLVHRLMPPVMGSMAEFYTDANQAEPLLRLYITGDTLMYEELKEIPSRYPVIDQALLHLGGTRAFGILVTMDGKQGVDMLRLISPKVAIPIHYNDFTVFKSPLEEFQREVRAAGLEQIIRYLGHGDMYTFKVLRK